MWLLCEYGGIAAYLHKFALARAWLDEASVCPTRANMALFGLGLVYLGFVESHTAEPTAAQHLHEGIAHIRLAGGSTIWSALDVATLPLLFGEGQQAAQVALAESIVGARELGDDWLMAVALSSARIRRYKAPRLVVRSGPHRASAQCICGSAMTDRCRFSPTTWP